MLQARLFSELTRPPKILCLGAHCDDIEIGCGGAILSIIEENPNLSITWVVFTSAEERMEEAQEGARLFTQNAQDVDVRIHEFKDGYLPYVGGEVKEAFEELKHEVQPDLIFTHSRQDLHQDHRKVCELTWNTYRNHQILEYEIPKWDGDLGVPNSFIHLSQEVGHKKILYLQQAYNSQQAKKWFTDDLFWSLMRIRGMESNSPSNLSEAFFSRKMVLSFSGE